MNAKCLLLLLLFLLPLSSSKAQSCNPASVYYIVRNEKGVVLSKTELQTIYDQMPKQIGDATVGVNEVSFTPDRKTYYWPESADWDKGMKVPALLFSNAGTCTLHLTEVSLMYHGRSMRLLFNVDIARHQEDRRQVIESPRFQAGTFRLDLTKWNHAEDKLIPAVHWRRVTQ